MADESHHLQKNRKQLPLLLFNVAIFSLSFCSAPLLTRIYFMHGGARLWLSSFLQNCGWPITIIPLSISYATRRRRTRSPEVVLLTSRAAAACVGLGRLNGCISYLYTFGSSRLPVTTSTLVFSTQLAFTAVFAFLIVKQRFTPFSVNSIVLLVIAAAILGFQSNGDRPSGESRARYLVGFFMTVVAAVLQGLIGPLFELVYKKVKQKVTYTLVMEMQLVVNASTTDFCLVGMVVNKDFQAIASEARAFGLGDVKYYMVLGFAVVLWQMLNLGYMGVISCSSSLLAGIVMSVLIPVSQVIPVLLLHERFNWGKGISIILSIWGFTSYLYGDWKQQQEPKEQQKGQELPAKNGALELE